MTQAAPEPARDDMPPVTIENDSENPAPPVNGTSIIDGDDALAMEWIADEFTESCALAEGIRSLARAAYRAAPENRRKAFELSAREAAGYADGAGISIARIADLFAAVAERNGLTEELGQVDVQIV